MAQLSWHRNVKLPKCENSASHLVSSIKMREILAGTVLKLHMLLYWVQKKYEKNERTPVAPVAQRYHVTSDTLGREFDPGKRDFSH